MAEPITNRHSLARWWDGVWPRRVFAFAVNAIFFALIVGGIDLPNDVSFLVIGLFFLLRVPTPFVIGVTLLTFGVYLFWPTGSTPSSPWLELLFLAVVGGGIAALWWDWRTIRDPRPVPTPILAAETPRDPEPEWHRQLAGVIGVWSGAIIGAILVVAYLLFGPFDSK